RSSDLLDTRHVIVVARLPQIPRDGPRFFERVFFGGQLIIERLEVIIHPLSAQLLHRFPVLSWRRVMQQRAAHVEDDSAHRHAVPSPVRSHLSILSKPFAGKPHPLTPSPFSPPRVERGKGVRLCSALSIDRSILNHESK